MEGGKSERERKVAGNNRPPHPQEADRVWTGNTFVNYAREGRRVTSFGVFNWKRDFFDPVATFTVMEKHGKSLWNLPEKLKDIYSG